LSFFEFTPESADRSGMLARVAMDAAVSGGFSRRDETPAAYEVEWSHQLRATANSDLLSNFSPLNVPALRKDAVFRKLLLTFT
jgi:hypothetical protein